MNEWIYILSPVIGFWFMFMLMRFYYKVRAKTPLTFTEKVALAASSISLAFIIIWVS
ncbi:hypothetical protein [Pontibacillus sp. HMF3514]|uniref:hypothetical protein n=1 Tax=Pontibacillus sp. HMF3514 TaxID=2692425 RepID=UPI00131F6C82|nr:hypothetical protein [Pontibacillus sp. HMF3514]QHE51058.1 hypothetical protein GS400_02930 [Pontibacillus sp. HMF3514]